MINRLLNKQREITVNKICRYYKEHYHPGVITVPTGTFGIYAVAKLFFSFGDKIIISPITCHTVIYALLSAGLVPVFVDIDFENGNIDARKINKSLLNGAKGIITTNLYGNPDQVLEIKKKTDKYDLLLIEDCAHVIHSSIHGREVGAIGDVSIFSFKKFFNEPGGIVALKNKTMGEKLRGLVNKESSYISIKEESLMLLQYYVSKSILAPVEKGMLSCFRKVRDISLGPKGDPQDYVPVESDDANDALQSENPRYRHFPTLASLLRVEQLIANMDQFLSERKRKNQALIKKCPLKLKSSPFADEYCHFKVPFFSDKRDEIIAKMKAKGIETWFLYNPTMNQIFRNYLNNLYPLDVDMIEEWSKRILPIDSRYTEEYIEVINSTERK